MSQKQISDLAATSRLRTGTLLELQDPVNGSGNITIDNLLAGVQWDSPSQVAGFTAADIMEIEAATKAGRVRLIPDAPNVPQAGWQIGRYMWSSATINSNAYDSLTTAAVTNGMILVFGWPNSAGICIPKKVTASLATGALSGTRAGSCDIQLSRIYGLTFTVGSTNVGSPGSQGGSGLTGLTNHGALGKLTNQPPSQAHVQGLVVSTTAQGYVDTNPIGTLKGGAPSIAGSTQINNSTLYDWLTAEQPLILSAGTGLQVIVNVPAAGTSQTIWYNVNIEWDEWTPVVPGDR